MAGLSKSDLIAALKEYGVTTEKRVREITNEIVGDAADKVLEGVERMFSKQNKHINKRFETQNSKIESIKSELKDEIDG